MQHDPQEPARPAAGPNCWLDDLRHRNGVFNQFVTDGLDQTDEWLGQVIAALEDAGTYENTNFVLLSDHGQMDYSRRIKINLLLRRGGFIDVDENGKITDWRALAQSNGMSATIFLKDPTDKALAEEVRAYLQGLADQMVWGFLQVQSEAEVRERYGMYGDFAFMVETDGYTSFSDDWNDPVPSAFVCNILFCDGIFLFFEYLSLFLHLPHL